MKNNLFKCILLLMLSFSLHVHAKPRPSSIRLSEHVPTKALKNASLMKRVEPTTQIPITFSLPLRNQEELVAFIEQIYDPKDQEYYRKYLSTAEFIERYAPTQEDYDKVVAYAKKLGLSVINTHPNRTLLNVRGQAKAIESAFNLKLHHYMLPSGRTFYAPNKDPAVPAEIASMINGIVGLDNHAKRRPYRYLKEMACNSGTSAHGFPSGPGGGFSPSDIVTAYSLAGVQGNGFDQVIALFELAGYQASDINAYTSHFGLPAANLTNVIVDGGSTDGIDAEVTLDIELAVALAPGSKIYVYEGPNSNQGVLDTYNRIATDNIAKQVSTSWGMGEDMSSAQALQAENAIFQQMAAQGQTIYAAAGDSGAYDDYDNDNSMTLMVDDPASQPYVVGVGGTSLTVDANSGAYQMESVWNNGLDNGAGGGGVSTVWPIPAWQSGVSTVYSMSNRNVPDVALDADPNTGYAIYFQGQWQIFGGTSCAAPLWAAFTACVNEFLAVGNKPALGFANPALYAIGRGMAYTTYFHDVTTGNNLYYNAGVGYDNATGWGSFNGTNLFAQLASPSPQLSVVLKHNAPFVKGATGNYAIIISNTGQEATSGLVSGAITLPDGLTFKAFHGVGWTFNNQTLTFTQDNSLSPGSSYAPIEIVVNVSELAPKSFVPSVTVSGGGAGSVTVQDPTTSR
jgi:kumamolisin